MRRRRPRLLPRLPPRPRRRPLRPRPRQPRLPWCRARRGLRSSTSNTSAAGSWPRRSLPSRSGGWSAAEAMAAPPRHGQPSRGPKARRGWAWTGVRSAPRGYFDGFLLWRVLLFALFLPGMLLGDAAGLALPEPLRAGVAPSLLRLSCVGGQCGEVWGPDLSVRPPGFCEGAGGGQPLCGPRAGDWGPRPGRARGNGNPPSSTNPPAGACGDFLSRYCVLQHRRPGRVSRWSSPTRRLHAVLAWCVTGMVA